MPRVAPHPDLDPTCKFAPSVRVGKVWTYCLESLDMSRAKGRAATGFSPKLQILANSLSLESLDIRSGKSGHESRQGSRRTRV